MAKDCCSGESSTPAKTPDGNIANLAEPAATLRLTIPAMDCPAEEAIIRKALGGMSGVTHLSFDLINRVLSVGHTLTDPKPVIDRLNSVGMQAVQDGASGKAGEGAHGHTHEHAPISRRAWILTGLAGVAAIGAEVLAYAIGNEQAPGVIALSLLAIALGGQETLRKGWIALKTFTLNINLLMSVAVIGAVAIGQWPEAAVVIWLFGIAELIESASLDRARNAIRKLMDLAPETAVVRTASGAWEEAKAATVPIGGIVRARPGERIALDGVVVNGESSVNQAPITGESMPVRKKTGDSLFAGTINEQGVLEYRVTAAKGSTTLDRIARSVQEAQGQRAPTQRFVDRFASVYTPLVLVVAILVAVVPPLILGQGWYEWLYKALVLLVIACPCALVISTPVTVVSGLAAAARRGIVVKGGLYIEQGRKLKSIALDKTGTVTHGKPAVTDVVPLAELDRATVLRLAASLEANSDHPIARAIVGALDGHDLAEVKNFESLTGRGIRGDVADTTYYIGNHRLIEELKVCNDDVEAQLDRLENEAKTAVVLARADRAIAVIAVADTVRASSKQAVAALKALGVATVMLTGDNSKTARAVAAQVGIEEVRGDMLPEDKLLVITELSKRGPVGMVGDGVNDAPALAKADVGFAMGAAGTDTAIETADVALMHDDLSKLVEFVELSVRTARILWQNIVIALGIKFVFFVLTLTGTGTLWMAVFADMGASIIVVFNGLRLMRVERDRQTAELK